MMRVKDLPPPNLCQLCAKYVGGAPPEGSSPDDFAHVIDASATCEPRTQLSEVAAAVQPFVGRENGHLFLRAPKAALS